MCNGLGYIIPIVLFSILYNITKFFEIETLSIRSEEWIIADNGTNISTVVFYPIYNGTALRWDPLYSKYVVFVLNFVIMGKRWPIYMTSSCWSAISRTNPSVSVIQSKLPHLQIYLAGHCHPQHHIFSSQVLSVTSSWEIKVKLLLSDGTPPWLGFSWRLSLCFCAVTQQKLLSTFTRPTRWVIMVSGSHHDIWYLIFSDHDLWKAVWG